MSGIFSLLLALVPGSKAQDAAHAEFSSTTELHHDALSPPPCPSALIRMMLTDSLERTDMTQLLGQCHDAQEALIGIIHILPVGSMHARAAYTEHDYFI